MPTFHTLSPDEDRQRSKHLAVLYKKTNSAFMPRSSGLVTASLLVLNLWNTMVCPVLRFHFNIVLLSVWVFLYWPKFCTHSLFLPFLLYNPPALSHHPNNISAFRVWRYGHFHSPASLKRHFNPYLSPDCLLHPYIPVGCNESHLVAGFPSDLVLWTLFPVVLFCWTLLISYYSKWNKGFCIFPTSYMSCPSHPAWFDCPNNCRCVVNCIIYITVSRK